MSEIRVDTISEKTSANGVAVDSLAIKDGKITNLMNATLSAADLGTGVHIKTADSGAGVNANADELVIEGSGNAGMSILAGASSKANIFLGDSGSSAIGNISYDHSDNSLGIGVNGAENFKILSTGLVTVTTADNENTLKLVSTDADQNRGPILTLHRNSGSPADGDLVGVINFNVQDDAPSEHGLAFIAATLSDATAGSEDGILDFNLDLAGTNRSRMTFNATEAVFNDDSQDLDFRVESNGNANMIFVDGGNDHVNIGTATDLGGVLNVSGTAVIQTDDNSDNLTLKSTDADSTSGPNFRLRRDSSSPADDDNLGNIFFSGEDSAGNETNYAAIKTVASDVTDGTEDGYFNISVANGGSLDLFLGITGPETVINDLSKDHDFRVESNGNTAMLHVNAGNDSVGIGTDSSVAPLHLMTNAPNFRISDANSSSEDSATGSIQFYDRNSDINSEILSGTGSTANLYITNYNEREISLPTNGQNDRLTVKSTGRVGIGQSSPAAKLDVEISDTNVPALEAHATSGSYSTEVVKIACSRNSTDSSYKFIACNVPGVNDRFQVVDDGDVLSATNSYGSLSDSRLKSDIVDANSQWDDIKALKIRNYKKFDMPNLTQIGVVAQELEAAGMTGLVDPQNPNEYEIAHNSAFGTLYTADDAETKDGNDDVLFVAEDAAVQNGRAKVGDIKEYATHSKKVGDIKEVKEQVKSVKYSVLYMKAIKALQEAMTRIETLEAEVTALKE